MSAGQQAGDDALVPFLLLSQLALLFQGMLGFLLAFLLFLIAVVTHLSSFRSELLSSYTIRTSKTTALKPSLAPDTFRYSPKSPTPQIRYTNA